MTDLRTVLKDANVRTALIVDDSNDEVPRAADLVYSLDDWDNFFDDIDEGTRARLEADYPRYDSEDVHERVASDAFVAALWALHREEVAIELTRPLFQEYERGATTDREYLDALERRLQGFGLECSQAGRDFKDAALGVDLLVVDLFLGSAQEDTDMPVDALAEVLKARASSPPLVILMSRSGRLEQKRIDFRDKSGLLESAFRIIRKAELEDAGKLERLVLRLAMHAAESRRLAEFLAAWRDGVMQACERTAALMRRLDLSDVAQVQTLVLEEEGQPTGSYLVDVFDLVLLHEVERDERIIAAANQLNGLTSDVYPAPNVAGAKDLQEIVRRSIFTNEGRLRLSGRASPVAFGDVLMRKRSSGATPLAAGLRTPGDAPEGEESAPPTPGDMANVAEGDLRTLRGLTHDEVLVVLTPACDLQRPETPAARVLLLKGELEPLLPKTWTYPREESLHTRVFEANECRYRIRWRPKELQAEARATLEAALEARDGVEIAGRLREAHALELQQKVLSRLGRVGLVVPLPATFPMQVEAYFLGTDACLFKLESKELEDLGGVCHVGRGSSRLVLSEPACEAVCAALAALDPESVHPEAREALAALCSEGFLLTQLLRGVPLPAPHDTDLKELKFSGDRALALLSRNGALTAGGEFKKRRRAAGIVLVAHDDVDVPTSGAPQVPADQ